nr:gag pol polyprotein [Hymenolepis microstoma]
MLRLRGVTKRGTWFQYAVFELPNTIATQFKGIKSMPPDNNSYDRLKQLSTVYLCPKRNASGYEWNNEILKELWVNCLPEGDAGALQDIMTRSATTTEHTGTRPGDVSLVIICGGKITQPLGKILCQAAKATTEPGYFPGRLLYVFERNSKFRFLLDTGSEVSVIPRSAEKRCLQAIGTSLLVTNNTKIPTYGQKFLDLDLGPCREFPFVFLIADVRKPIIGANFLSKFQLLISFRDSALHDNVTSLQLVCSTQTINFFGLNAILPTPNPFSNILSEFPSIFHAQTEISESKYEVRHYIPTKGQPVFARARRLHLHKLRAAKQELQNMVSLSKVQPSNSPWASPLHIVAKKNGD